MSVSGSQLTTFKATFFILVAVAGIWLSAAGSLIFAIGPLNNDASQGREKTVANGSIYMSACLLAFVLNAAVIAPALLLLQPRRLWRVTRDVKYALTPRQRFRGEHLHESA